MAVTSACLVSNIDRVRARPLSPHAIRRNPAKQYTEPLQRLVNGLEGAFV